MLTKHSSHICFRLFNCPRSAPLELPKCSHTGCGRALFTKNVVVDFVHAAVCLVKFFVRAPRVPRRCLPWPCAAPPAIWKGSPQINGADVRSLSCQLYNFFAKSLCRPMVKVRPRLPKHRSSFLRITPHPNASRMPRGTCRTISTHWP